MLCADQWQPHPPHRQQAYRGGAPEFLCRWFGTGARAVQHSTVGRCRACQWSSAAMQHRLLCTCTFWICVLFSRRSAQQASQAAAQFSLLLSSFASSQNTVIKFCLITQSQHSFSPRQRCLTHRDQSIQTAESAKELVR